MIKVDNKTFKSKKSALAFFMEAMIWCEGSEGECMTYAYCAISEGYKNIDTYKGVATL